uniref:Uncharacterized protein n=1 Tax=Romanomermis culicivorax TaxID=13658 RepID=A0A915KYB9_ROMCU
MSHSSAFPLLLFCSFILLTVSKSAGYYLIDENENVRRMPKRASMNDLLGSKYLDRCKLVDDQYQRLGAHLFHANLTVPFKVFHPIRQLDTLHDGSSSSSATSSAEKPRSSSSGKRECDRQQRRTMMIGSTPHQSELAIRERALCPWEWRVNYDPRRWPAHLVEARCLCDEVKEDVQVSGVSYLPQTHSFNRSIVQ